MTKNRPIRTDCGSTFAHDWHLFTSPRGKVKVCDGSISKQKERIRNQLKSKED